MDTSKDFFTISQISSRLNVSTPTLRYWEREFAGILVPHRTKGGQRRYTIHHIAIIKKISTLKKAGLKLAEIKRELKRFRKDVPPEADGIDLLADKVADMVRAEVIRFLRKAE
jgi:DNA-binding transcriptional MerR regulator